MSYQGYQAPNTPYQTDGQTAARPFSIRWPIGFFITSIIFYAIGGGLLSSFNSCWANPDTDYCSTGTYNGGLAMSALGGVASLAWIITLILYLTRRNRKIHWNAATGLLDKRNFASQPTQQYQQPQPAPEPMVPEMRNDGGYNNGGMRFCGQCGSSVRTAFCPRCGSSVPDV